MAGSFDFTIEQGATFNLLMTWKIDNVPVNLTNWTARLQARVDVEDTEVVLNLTTENGGITLGGALGTITLNQTAIQTAVLQTGSFVYDLELISSVSSVTRLLQGELTISAEVTR
jgi:predicted MFS family arabinose efflux permease